jgi:hypothetical protein
MFICAFVFATTLMLLLEIGPKFIDDRVVCD